MSEFVNDDLRQYIRTVIKTTVLPNLNTSEFNKLMAVLYELINYIAIRFNFDLSKPDQYIYQLKQNNNRDLYAMFNMLLPYIDDAELFLLHKDIYNISDISTKKKEDVSLVGFIDKSDDKDQNITKNPYKITNIQFNRNIRILDNNEVPRYTTIDDVYSQINTTQKYDMKNIDKKHYLEYKLTFNDILNNFYLLLNSIDQISNKLYINWINIRPIKEKYKESSLYKKSFKYNEESKKIEVLIDGVMEEFNWYNPLSDNMKYDYSSDRLITQNRMRKYQGLSCGDIYNMIHHELYYGIKSYKWLIYDMPLDDKKNKLYNYWDYIKSIFNKIDELIDVKMDYDSIMSDNLKLIEDWNNSKERILEKISSNRIIIEVIRNILYYIQRKYSDQTELKESGFVELKIKGKNNENISEEYIYDVLDPDIDDNKMEILKTEDIIISWRSLNMSILYKYLMETIDQFKKTWYGYQIITLKNPYPKFGDEKYCNINPNDDNDKISYKYIYNWAKSILLYVYGGSSKGSKNLIIENMEYYREYNWHSLSSFNDVIDPMYKGSYDEYLLCQKNNFIEAMNTSKEDNWFSIMGILKKKYNRMRSDDIKIINDNIYDCIRRNIIDICFECLWIRGILNEFVPDKDLTDNKLLGSVLEKEKKRTLEIKKKLFTKSNVDEYKKCIYYLTNEPYDKLPYIVNKNDKPKTYFEALETMLGKGWGTFYGMDWVFQITFFHRFINCRVLYVTGGTGAGKSSQVPKLLLYGLKMVNFNNKGKVVSTQPRIAPTRSNAINIASEMGVPINEYSETLEEAVQTFSGYIQYKSMTDSFVIDKSEYYFKEMTDGSLVSELYRNPLLKKPKILNKDDPFEDTKMYSKENVYDIIVVDESHEHNKNMDYILSLMKYAAFWNNSLRLIIISATMTDDEPIYRRYYRDLNDNMKFPLSLYNPGNLYKGDDNQPYSLDRCTIDRRVHISPPGESTQYVVVDIYLDIDTKDYTEAEAIGMEKIKQLIDTRATGDILFFSIGKAYIIKIVETLNNYLPENVIALPYYSELPSFWRDLGEKTYQIVDFDVNKLDIFKEIEKPRSGRKIKKGTYNQVIVVATNVAEASITINNLRHVIDTGYANVVTYDSITRISENSISPISEMSRIQRRGRVGRVAGGTVYYMYKRGARSEIKSNFGISISDISNDIFSMMRTNYDENLFIHPAYNVYNINKKIYKSVMTSKSNDFLDKVIKKKYVSFYLTLYLLDTIYSFKKIKYILKPSNYDKELWENINEILSYNYSFHLLNDIIQSDGNVRDSFNLLYFGDGKLSENVIMLNNPLYKMHDRYMSGYNVTSLVDLYGSFHIIHPSENLGNRHILTGMINVDVIGPKFDRNFIIKSFSNINELFYARMIIPLKPRLKTDYSLKSLSDKELTTFITNKNGYFKGMYENMIGDTVIYDYIDDEKYIDDTNDCFSKTVFAEKLLRVIDKLDISSLDKELTDSKDENFKRGCIGVLICGLSLNIELEVCKTISALLAFGNEMKILVPEIEVKGKKRSDIKKSAVNQFRNNYGDLITLYNIFDTLQKDLNYLSIWDPLNEETNNKLDQNYKTDVLTFKKTKNNIINKINQREKNVWNNVMSKDEYKKFIVLQKLDQKGLLSEKSGLNEYKKEEKKKLKRDDISEGDYEKIILWAVNRNLPYKNIQKMVNIYINLLSKIKIEDKDNIFDWFKKNVIIKKEQSIQENILKCFLYGFTSNISYYNPSNKLLTHIISKINMPLKPLYPSSNITDTTILPSKYVLYLAKDQKTKEPLNLNNIKIEWLFEILPDIFNKTFVPDNFQIIDDNVYSYIYNDILQKFSIQFLDKNKNIIYTDEIKKEIKDIMKKIDDNKLKLRTTKNIDKDKQMIIITRLETELEKKQRRDDNLIDYYNSYLKLISQ